MASSAADAVALLSFSSSNWQRHACVPLLLHHLPSQLTILHGVLIHLLHAIDRVRFLLFAFLSRALASALLSRFPFTSSSNDKRLRPLANNLERRGLGGDDELLVAQQQQHKAVAALAAPNVVAAANDHRWPLHERACSLVVTVT
ncbi:hypothetical protein OsJ_29298 [Oryza sativa Japonica Group]|uniref:Uncharacterized protein n=1 Tax=Oryza sativa subsp. japonica TaxID=39947 RepID=B9G3H4_ORYSJ|nr:hypothetical protein OsJ_29298 [Oryza sativa Japonica Group]